MGTKGARYMCCPMLNRSAGRTADGIVSISHSSPLELGTTTSQTRAPVISYREPLHCASLNQLRLRWTCCQTSNHVKEMLPWPSNLGLNMTSHRGHCQLSRFPCQTRGLKPQDFHNLPSVDTYLLSPRIQAYHSLGLPQKKAPTNSEKTKDCATVNILQPIRPS